MDFTGLKRAVLLSESKYFNIWLGIKALVSSYHWLYDADGKKMTMSILPFAMVLNAMLANLKVGKKKNINLMWQ